MLASQIVRTLPGSLEWMVLFDLSTLRRLVADEVVKAMYSLPRGMDLDPYSHVVLTSQGTLVALRDEPTLLEPTGETGRKQRRPVLRRPFPEPPADPRTLRCAGPVRPREPLQPVLPAARFDRRAVGERASPGVRQQGDPGAGYGFQGCWQQFLSNPSV